MAEGIMEAKTPSVFVHEFDYERLKERYPEREDENGQKYLEGVPGCYGARARANRRLFENGRMEYT